MNFKDIVLKNKDEILNTLVELLKIPSVLEEYNPDNKEYPFGKDIRKALDYFLELGNKDGFKTYNCDNYAGHIEIGEGETFAILAHLDVVPATGNWDNPPFKPIYKNGKIYARGAMDDKGPLIASYYALKFLKDLGYKFNKKVRLIAGCDEESGSRCINYYSKKVELPKEGFSPDAEFPLIYGEKGITSFDILYNKKPKELLEFNCGTRYNLVPDYAYCKLEINLDKEFKKYLRDNNLEGIIKDNNTYELFGKSAHGSTPNLGINAGYLLIKFLNNYLNYEPFKLVTKYFDTTGKNFNIDSYSKDLKYLSMNMAIFKLINNQFKIGINFRYPNQNDPKNIDKAFKELTKYDSNFEIKHLEDSIPHLVDSNDILVQTLYNSYKKYTNDNKNKPYTIGGGTYARLLKKGVAFGMMFPNREDVFHMPNEYIIIEDLINGICIYMDAIYNLCVLEK